MDMLSLESFRQTFQMLQYGFIGTVVNVLQLLDDLWGLTAGS